jgi:hypothetical protein
LQHWLREVVVESRFFPLLAVLVSMLFFVYPLTLERGEPGLLLTIFLVTMFLVSIRAISNQRAMLVVLILVAVPMFLLRIAIGLSGAAWIAIAHGGVSLLFFLLLMLVCLRRVLERSPVSEDKIIGAICVYLLIGVIFAFVYEIIYLVDPTSLDVGETMMRTEDTVGTGDFWVFTYFSYVTLTTLGYGDVLPVGLFARSMATLEAIVGPLYLAILIARLVSLVDTPASRKETAGGTGTSPEAP